MFRGTRTLPDTRSVIRGLASHHQSQPLLPPLMLYRRILREHKHLPAIQREMGDEYVKNEFKLHQNIDNPLHIVGFLTSWQDYLTLISNGNWKEASMNATTLEKLSPDQVTQLYELMKESEKLYKDPNEETEKDEILGTNPSKK
ncbi:hypothetical protein NCAS_0A00380 [Naumovozyma castellii]|uniref:Succinate dehydrogenase assembly factor 3 n=1 Tax=Naumovozyma castellii TaxID=27288 RepID=G0V562_NAUCA|nr:hypothetical protein NCAS_0A00380 [Naumovozyma castellii CBS 4309]CCC66598.1 hypothetical protein NCAS_0A00380 [Naumovozyma castellii CBS 4309]